MKYNNPFVTHGYRGPTYFCDRVFETNKITSALLNHRNVTLYGRRKLGKTALVKHIFQQLPKQVTPVWIDLFPTNHFADLLHVTATSILKTIDENTSRGKKIWTAIKKLRPTLSYDELSGTPTISFDLIDKDKIKVTFETLLAILKSHNHKVIIAFDEFQQILKYPEDNIEAYLRTILQELNNYTFIFSGSDQHLLTKMFVKSDQPFYQMSQLFKLKKIEENVYKEFIIRKFRSNNTKISDNAVNLILNYSSGITYYIQMICNRLYSLSKKNINSTDVNKILQEILLEFEDHFHAIQNLLTLKQRRVLRAIAISGIVEHPYNKEFMKKHGFTNASSLKRSIESLYSNQLLYRGIDQEKTWIEIQDIFLRIWLMR